MHTWDLRTRRCLFRQQDEGAICSTALAACPTDGQLAVGSDLGMLNLYASPASRCACLLCYLRCVVSPTALSRRCYLCAISMGGTAAECMLHKSFCMAGCCCCCLSHLSTYLHRLVCHCAAQHSMH